MSFARGVAEKEEATAAQISGLGMDDGERESSSYGGVDRVAAGVQHLDTGARGEFVDAGDHGVGGMRGAQRRGCNGRG